MSDSIFLVVDTSGMLAWLLFTWPKYGVGIERRMFDKMLYITDTSDMPGQVLFISSTNTIKLSFREQ